jgi:uncharacterized protein with von Willebrand factor type A (vWA) domain
MRGTLRASLRGGGATLPLKRRQRSERLPPLVMLCDISGSMERYARIFLHYMHAVANHRPHVHCFVFGTRLTNISRALLRRDPDEAMACAADQMADWAGGTRICDSLHRFNRDWSRRVLGQGAELLLVTDGLDRSTDGDLAREAERLKKSCGRLIWLNPLLRWEGFAPKAAGVRALLPWVDEFRPVHNLNSLEALGTALGAPPTRKRLRSHPAAKETHQDERF